MTWPQHPVRQSLGNDGPSRWGVEGDPAVRPPSRARRILWIALSLLIVLSLTLPWLLPYFVPQLGPVREGIEAMLIEWLS